MAGSYHTHLGGLWSGISVTDGTGFFGHIFSMNFTLPEGAELSLNYSWRIVCVHERVVRAYNFKIVHSHVIIFLNFFGIMFLLHRFNPDDNLATNPG